MHFSFCKNKITSQSRKEESDKEKSPPSGDDERPKSKSPPDKSRTTLTPPQTANQGRSTMTPPPSGNQRSPPDRTRSTVTPPSSANQQTFRMTGTGSATIATGTAVLSGGGNQKSEYDDVPGENEAPFTFRKLELPAAKSSPGIALLSCTTHLSNLSQSVLNKKPNLCLICDYIPL